MLSGNRFIITGANGGIGYAICKELLKNNFKLVLLYHEKRNRIDDLLKTNKTSNLLCEIHQVNLRDDSKLEQILSEILRSGPVDGFIHCVTLPLEIKNITETKWQDFQSQIEVQTKSFFKIVQSILPSMKSKKSGIIISILTSGIIGRPPNNMSSYIVGKYSLLGLSKALSVELGQFGITVNCVSPFMTNTPLIEKLPSKLKEVTAAQSPIGRLVEPNEVASVVLFLCSKDASCLSGENIIVSAGQTMH